jgi:hypothetical protein
LFALEALEPAQNSDYFETTMLEETQAGTPCTIPDKPMVQPAQPRRGARSFLESRTPVSVFHITQPFE